MTEDEVVAKYLNLAWWTAQRRVPALDVADAVQDALLGIVVAHRKFDPALGGDWYDRWIILAIERSIIDGQRQRTNYDKNRHQKRSTVPLGDLEPLADDVPEDQIMASDLEAFLRSLEFDDPADTRVWRGMLDGRKRCDIAAEMGVTPSRVSQRIVKIRGQVARAIAR